MKKVIIIMLLLGGAIIITSYQVKMSISREVLSVLGIDDQDFILNFLYCNNNPNCFIGPPPLTNLSTLKALATGDKLSLANEAFAFAKNYCSSQEFKDLYQKRRMELKPRVEKLTPEQREQALEQVKQQEEMFSPEILAMLPPEAQAEARKSLEDMKAMANGEMSSDQKKQWDELAPEDPNTSVSRILKNFLDKTADVDFNATTTLNPENNHQVFTNPDYEDKDDQWKACYRAGRELTDAARNFARQWHSELN